MLYLKQGTIAEVFSKILYDRTIDPADFEIIFWDSDKLRCVPFTYIVPVEGGFKYKGSFYPLYKIVGIRNSRSGKYLLKRNFRGFIEGDLGIELYDYPVQLSAIYDEFALHRYAADILTHIENKIRKEGELKQWLKALGDLKKFILDDVELYMIIQEGPFRGTFFLIFNGTPQGFVRSIPSPIFLSKIFEKVRFHRVILQVLRGHLLHLIRTNSLTLKLKDIDRKVEIMKHEEDSKYPNKLSLFFAAGEGSGKRELIAVCNQRTKLFLRFEDEIRIAKHYGFEQAPIIEAHARVADLHWIRPSKGSLLKIHDHDVIFSVADIIH
mgnify:CR=1 FL=1